MNTYRTLIVEDEVLIAHTIERYLTQRGHEVVGTAICYEEAQELYAQMKPDIALLDIRLSGTKSGLDVANFIQSQTQSSPFIFLTSQVDSRTIHAAKHTMPAGYLPKPIRKESLYATMEIAMFQHQIREQSQPCLQLINGSKQIKLPLEEILYLEADHVYVKFALANGKKILHRSSLKDFADQLPAAQFVQTHRSFIVNLPKISAWDAQQVFVGEKAIPLSRSKRKDVLEMLER